MLFSRQLIPAAEELCYMKKMEYMLNIQELEKYFETADFIDEKVFEGDTTLRRFIASILSYYPWWVIML